MKKLVLLTLFSWFSIQCFAGDDRLRISHMEVTQAYNVMQIAGVATNQSNKEIKHAFIKFNLYNGQGALVGNTITAVDNLGAGEEWDFKALSPINFETAKISEVNLYD